MKKVDKSPERIQKMFGEIAPRYDFLNHFLSLGIDYSWRRRTVREVFRFFKKNGDTLTAPILDVATGTGDLALEFLRQERRAHLPLDYPEKLKEVAITDLQGALAPISNYKIVAVDFVPEMLWTGMKKVKTKKAENEILMAQADGLNLPFESNTFSAVSIAFGLRNMSDTDRGIAELIRVCQSCGLVAILEFTMPTFPVFASLYRFYFRKILPRLGQRIARNAESAYQYLPESVQTFDDRDAMKERLVSAGLKNVKAISMTFGTVTLYLGEKKES